MTSDQLVSAYIKIREAVKELETAYKEQVKTLETDKDVITAELLDLCNKENINGFKTDAGTVSRRVQSRYWASDWEDMYKFIQENSMPQLLEKRIHNGNMREFIADNPTLVPPGLQTDNKYTITVTKPRGT